MSGRLNFKRDKTSFQKQNSTKGGSYENKRPYLGCRFISPMRFLKNIKEEVAKALVYVAKRTRTSQDTAASSCRSNTSVAPMDNHRVEAVNDCIQFINASSSSNISKPISIHD